MRRDGLAHHRAFAVDDVQHAVRQARRLRGLGQDGDGQRRALGRLIATMLCRYKARRIAGWSP
jgi:hypothetical protein